MRNPHLLIVAAILVTGACTQEPSDTAAEPAAGVASDRAAYTKGMVSSAAPDCDGMRASRFLPQAATRSTLR